MENKKTNKWLLVFLSVAIIGIIIYFMYKYLYAPTVIATTDLNNGTGAITTKYSDVVNNDKILYYGDKSNNIIEMQKAINGLIDKHSYNLSKLSVDGVFGNKTKDALTFVSGGLNGSGNITTNKVLSLKQIGALNPSTTTENPQLLAATKQQIINPFAKYKL